MTLVETANKIFAILTLLSQILIVIFVVLIAAFRENRILSFVSQRAVLLSFLVSLSAVLGSLFYSNVIGYPPCEFCWFQRIFMYSAAVILAMALWKKDEKIIDYILALSFIGALIAGYQYFLQMGLTTPAICSAISVSSACTKIYVLEFGYITIPLMSLTTFLLIMIFAVINKLSFRQSDY